MSAKWTRPALAQATPAQCCTGPSKSSGFPRTDPNFGFGQNWATCHFPGGARVASIEVQGSRQFGPNSPKLCHFCLFLPSFSQGSPGSSPIWSGACPRTRHGMKAKSPGDPRTHVTIPEGGCSIPRGTRGGVLHCFGGVQAFRGVLRGCQANRSEDSIQ